MVWKLIPREATLAILAVCLLSTLPYLSTLGGHFLADDYAYVSLHSQRDWSEFLGLFAADWSDGIYGQRLDELKPLPALSYKLDSLFGAGSALSYHRTNIGLHLLTALLVLASARFVAGLTWPAAASAAILFGVLPVHAETVGWITGRVDSIPALCYLVAFLAYVGWRRVGAGWLYGGSLGAFVLALYSKQSAITMLGTLLAYDALVGRELARAPRRTLSAYVPFALLTLGYLVERYILFGNAVREGPGTLHTLLGFGSHQLRQLELLVFGSASVPRLPVVLEVGLVALVAGFGLLEFRRSLRGEPVSIAAKVLFFGPIWWAIQTAPLLVTYLTPRHLYLAAVGPTIAFGIGVDLLFRSASARRRVAGVVVASLAVLVALLRGVPGVESWSQAARVSGMIQRDLEREVMAAPEDSLLLVAAPTQDSDRGTTSGRLIWIWVTPFAYRPPFTAMDLTQRVRIVEGYYNSCCQRAWPAATRETVGRWSSQDARGSVVVLTWDRDSGTLTRRSDDEIPELRDAALGVLRLPESNLLETCKWFNGVMRVAGSDVDPCAKRDI